MALSDDERVVLGALIRDRREKAYGTKKAAYTKADVNSATWDKAEQGKSVRPDLLRSIVRLLWPSSEGDWSAVVGGGTQDPGYVSSPGATAERTASDEDVLRRIEEMERSLRELRATVEGPGDT